MLFKDERTLFTTDFPADALVINTMRSLPSACGPFDGHPMDEWIKSYRTLEALDFDISVGGHGAATDIAAQELNRPELQHHRADAPDGSFDLGEVRQ